jgi:hypothetical protein
LNVALKLVVVDFVLKEVLARLPEFEVTQPPSEEVLLDSISGLRLRFLFFDFFGAFFGVLFVFTVFCALVVIGSNLVADGLCGLDKILLE